MSLPPHVETLGKNAFSFCKELKEVKFENGLKEVGDFAFAYCSGLIRVAFPATLEKIGSSLFERCNSLRAVEFAGDAPAADISNGSVLGKTPDDLVIFVAPRSKGWSSPGSAELPQRWPLGAFEDSRPVRHMGKSNDARERDSREAESPDKNASQKVIFPCADSSSTKWKSRTPWRYMTQYPSPRQSGAKWMEPEFRDSGWKRTNKPFGSGKSKELMRIADRWGSPSLYLRRHFAWKGEKVARVEFTLYHACNVKIYLNGDLVLEKEDRNDWWEKIEIPVEAFASALRGGDNVLAVEAQDNFGVRYFDCGLTVEVEEVK